MTTTHRKTILSLSAAALSIALVTALLLLMSSAAQSQGILTTSESIRAYRISSLPPAPSTLKPFQTSSLPDSILVAFDPAYPPMTSISGATPIGHDIDLMDAIALEMGVTVDYTPVSWGDLLTGLIAGEYDAAIAGITITPDREAVMDFSLPYLDYDPDDSLGIAIGQGDDLLRTEINTALWRLRADGTLAEIVAGVDADEPGWGVRMPDWPTCWARINDGLVDYNHIQTSVDATQEGDLVKVAGTCTGAEARDIFTQTVYISKTITLQGGYTTTNWTDPRPDKHITLLDAQRQGRVMTIVGETTPVIDGFTLTGGSAHHTGFADSSGGIHVVTAQPIIRNCLIFNNSAVENAGGVSVSYSDGVVIENSQIISNTAVIGGGLDVWLSKVSVYNSVIAGNSAGTGSGVYAENADLTFINTTLDNTGGDGIGLTLKGAPFGSSQYSLATLTNTIIVSHTIGISVSEGSTATMEATLWNNVLNWGGDGAIFTGTINISGDPTFRDTGSWDYHLTTGSDGLDTGVPVPLVTDIDGDTRPQGGGYDLGADEHTFCNDVSEIPWSECRALVDLYHSTDGDHWTTNTDWLLTLTPCSWYGLACASGQITELDLPGNQLSGTLPASIGDLAALQDMGFGFGGDFMTNELCGALPPEIGELSQLQSLNLDANDFSGDLPVEIGQLKSLDYLALSHNNFTGSIPPQLASIEPLVQLKIADNKLTGSIPPQLGKLPNLAGLWLNVNQLSGEIPPELGQINSLLQLSLDANALSGQIPAELGDLENLSMLRLRHNQFTGDLPVELTNLSSLTSLYIDYNGLTASDPGLIAFLNTLEPGWADTQTVPPGDLVVDQVDGNQIDLSWTPITYTQDGGYYEIFAAIHPGGPFIQHGQTLSKTISAFSVTDLVPDTTYYFQVRTHTPAHDWQQSDLWSGFSILVSGITEDIGAQISVDPGSTETLLVTDTHGLTTTVLVPAGAVTATTTLVYIEALTTTAEIPPDFSFAGVIFDLNAYVDGARVDPFTFTTPITITLHYSEAILSAPEETLRLMTWVPDSERWLDAACRPYVRNLAENWLSVPICHLSHFALLGEEYRIYLPLVIR